LAGCNSGGKSLNGYVLALDLLGFGNIIKNSSEADLPNRIQEWISLTEKAKQSSGLSRVQLISDTVFVSADSSPSGLKALVAFSKVILNEGIPQSLPVRGAISHGPYEWGTLIYGKAVVDAHILEANQDWIGITCANDLPHIDQVWDIDSVLCYPTPLKSGYVCLNPVISWDVPEYTVLSSYLMSKGLTTPGEIIQWPLLAKLNNTVQFGIYRKIIKEAGLDCKTFRGTSPMEAIALNVRQVPQNK
jgi:hypothetical protein